ncbi:iron chaperone [Leptothrix sp. BB-4]
MSTPATATPIDDYIAAQPAAVRPLLEQVRAAARRAAPDAAEVISYRIPALRQHGVLVYFAAFQRHIGFYPPVRGDDALVQEAARYAGEKGNLRFPLDQPLPLDLIERLTRLRLAQDTQQHAERATRRRRP